MNKTNEELSIQTMNWAIVLSSLWLILSPFLLGFSGTLLSVNNIITGVVIAVLSLVAIGMPDEGKWLNWATALLGFWIFITPFFLVSFSAAGFWNNLIVGIVVVSLAIRGALSPATSAQHPKPVS